MSNRLIKSNARGGSVQLTDSLRSLFSLELFSPSQELYLISPWISNVSLISNRFGQFRTVLGDSGDQELRLAEILTMLADRGTLIRIIFRNHPETEDFLRTLPDTIERRRSKTLHEKGLITSSFYLRGSMNFTFSGINLNDEGVEFTTEPGSVSLALMEARQRWKDLAL